MAVSREGPQQELFFRWLKFTHPEVDAHTTHVPNGGLRNKRIAAQLKREGVKPGFPDILVTLPKGQWAGLLIEFKAARPHSASVSKEQKARLERLNKAGYLAVVCRGVGEAKKAVEDYLLADEVPY